MTKTTFFENDGTVYGVLHTVDLKAGEGEKLSWLLNAQQLAQRALPGRFIGPRREMITPWSTNAVEIANNTGLRGIERIEAFTPESGHAPDPMLQQIYDGLDGKSLINDRKPGPIEHVSNIGDYNRKAGLALSDDEIKYLEAYATEKKRPLTDSELFGFAQVNSEHCRHKIFNGTYIIDGEIQERSLFQWIKETAARNPGGVVTRYNDNVAFVNGKPCEEFAPENPAGPSNFRIKKIETVLSLKAETHNFPTTVEPFNGAATGSGGEIRDRMAGGRGSIPLAGTACYMTSYPRLSDNPWEDSIVPRPWLYQSPQQILTKASNGASDFGNKFGQPLINGSLLTFEYAENGVVSAFDKTIMLAGGIGIANRRDALKNKPTPGDQVVLLGGDNYRIGLGGGAVSSLDTGVAGEHLELNAVQRSNPEMQKRAYNCIRGLLESTDNPIILIHDHGAGGHINCLSELVENAGGHFDLAQFPLGDPSLSDREIVGNESQERMGLVVKKEDLQLLKRVAERERAPLYVIGEVTGDGKLVFQSTKGDNAVDVELAFLFGKPPKTVIEDHSQANTQSAVRCTASEFEQNLLRVLRLEGVACKDWLTNKVDRSVTGRVAQQQCVGPLQLPLHGAGVMALDYTGEQGIATSMGHQPAAGLMDPEAGSVLSICEALTNLVFVPIDGGLRGVTLGANWMWPCKFPGEDARLYKAVRRAAEFTMELGINISTGKDSLSMTQKYADSEVKAPGTVIISAVGSCESIRRIVTPDLKPIPHSQLLYINLSGKADNALCGGSLAQTQGILGATPPGLTSANLFAKGFDIIQSLVKNESLLAGQDISSGGLITAALEMAFTGCCGLSITWEDSNGPDEFCAFLFCEKPGALLQVSSEKSSEIIRQFADVDIPATSLATVLPGSNRIDVRCNGFHYQGDVSHLRRRWFESSALLETFQATPECAKSRRENFDKHPLDFKFPAGFDGTPESGRPSGHPLDRSYRPIQAAILREKGTNGEREMAYALYAAGFDVRDVTMTDIAEGREDLRDVNFLVYCGGFSNSDVLGSARGWAGVFRYNPGAAEVLTSFYQRSDTLSLGVCNGCQLMVLLDLLAPETEQKISMERNASGKFESAFLSVDVPRTNAVLLQGLIGSRLGIWVAHGEGRFALPESEDRYNIALKYSHSAYPANPNGSAFDAAGLVSKDGRHLAMMPHLERSLFPWQWAYYPRETVNQHTVTPWHRAFVDGRKWIEGNIS